MRSVTNLEVPMEPHLYIIYIFNVIQADTTNELLRDDNRSHINKEWEQIVRIIARRCLTKHWIMQTTPKIEEIEKDIQHLFRLEKLEMETLVTTRTLNKENLKEDGDNIWKHIY